MNRRQLVIGSVAAAFSAIPGIGRTQASAPPVDPRVAVIDVVGRWYQALRERDRHGLFDLIGPGAIIDRDLEHCRNPDSRRCDIVFAPDFLAFGASRFTTEIRQIEVQEALARVTVRVREWFPSQSGTYERAAHGEFYLRRWPEKGWLVAAVGEETASLR